MFILPVILLTECTSFVCPLFPVVLLLFDQPWLFFFFLKYVKKLPVTGLNLEESDTHVLRVGWSVDNSSFQLGEHLCSAYGGGDTVWAGISAGIFLSYCVYFIKTILLKAKGSYTVIMLQEDVETKLVNDGKVSL